MEYKRKIIKWPLFDKLEDFEYKNKITNWYETNKRDLGLIGLGGLLVAADALSGSGNYNSVDPFLETISAISIGSGLYGIHKNRKRDLKASGAV